ncbi:LysR family transcriptional regulator [Pandoraea horticolens]|uniref:LysR family transcriptional regulator n=1 Tax=Pandoraea horticolens TaxID=2508298 RepID=A0A5E4UA94_9BURK|nr:LysR family transcriptional regulator [Pandoraea horticolens]VVD95794.1 LysR family transcriptional regulator [Pandoraea horticolens]
MKNLDLELLRTFVAVADARSFAGAGVRIGRTQAAVSQQMQRLEALVGVPLFRREAATRYSPLARCNCSVMRANC